MATKCVKVLCRGRINRVISRKYVPTMCQNSRLNSTDSKEDFTHFGFQTVPEFEKEERVYEVFHNVAEKYDTMNDAMSAGIHRLWKDYFMEQLGPTPGTSLIDVAGGTGDIAFRFLRYVHSQQNNVLNKTEFHMDIPQELQHMEHYKVEHKDSSSDSSDDEHLNGCSTGKQIQTHVTVCDINQAMLDVGKKRAKQMDLSHGISWLKGNAEFLPVDDNSYDAYTIAYGIRNCTHIDKVLTEARRVLKPGGRFMCLEFSYVPNTVLRMLYNQYSFQVIPVLGQIIASDWKSYQYLVESIRTFPKQEEFAEMLRDCGFSAVTYENLFFGVSAIHSGFKL